MDTFVAVSHLCRISPQIEKGFFFSCVGYILVRIRDPLLWWATEKGRGGEATPCSKMGADAHTPSSLTLLIRFELPGHEKKYKTRALAS